MINVSSIVNMQRKSIIDWHTTITLSQRVAPWCFIEENNKWNFLLWHEEDIARLDDVDPITIVNAKRNIDKYNQLRNNAIEKIDEWILESLRTMHLGEVQNMHSETPGMMIDRLSILALKRYHMYIETIRPEALVKHKERCSVKLKILDEQIEDLSNCLNFVLLLLQSGKLKFKVYRQLKMYNDPTLNPILYNRAKQ